MYVGLDISKCNVLEFVDDLLHFGFWVSYDVVVKKMYRVFNKIFSMESIEKFMS